jgi:hypothetical protein
MKLLGESSYPVTAIMNGREELRVLRYCTFRVFLLYSECGWLQLVSRRVTRVTGVTLCPNMTRRGRPTSHFGYMRQEIFQGS